VTSNIETVRRAYYDKLEPQGLAALWTVLDDLVTPSPRTPAVPQYWRYDGIRPLLIEAGEIISAEEAVRRVLILENPAMPGTACLTRTLYAGLQLILPGEVAPCHRHTQSALRFVLEGEGAYTAVDGERAIMRPFDLVLTPNGRWHDHANQTDKPMIWLDGLDIPLVRSLDASFAEIMSGAMQHPETKPAGACQALYGEGLRPLNAARPTDDVALFHYPFAKWRAALNDVSKIGSPDEYDGYAMEFVNPATGGAVMNTISAFCHLLPAGFEGAVQRSTDGVIYVGVEGHGHIHVGDKVMPIGPRDVVVAPSWAGRRITAQNDLVLFAYSDRVTQQKLGLWKTDRASSSGSASFF
jgi:gentisate 1,2-dioxygenase